MIGLEGQLRLDRFLSDAGQLARSEAKKAIRQGRVRVNDISEKSPERKVSEKDVVSLDGRVLKMAPDFVYYLLNKPAGYLSATQDKSQQTVLDLVPHDKRRDLFPVGRLDKDTEGLLLITDDGGLAHRLLSPANHVDKTYYALVRGAMTREDVKAFQEGLDIGDEKPTLPAELKILSVKREGQAGEDTLSRVEITVREGRFHQVKRMVMAVGKEVIYLKRLSMGPLMLPDDLAEGEFRQLLREEILF